MDGGEDGLKFRKRHIFLLAGIILFAIGYFMYEDKPDTMYATRPYGQGIVRYENKPARIFSRTGLVCLGIWLVAYKFRDDNAQK